MKKIIFYLMLIVFVFTMQVSRIIAQKVVENIKMKGKISPNSENEKNDPDPGFNGFITSSIFKPQLSKSGDSKNISELENGLQIIKDIMQTMIEKEYRFSLLSGHKYMMNSCLGLKVSAGEFSLRFGQPVIEIGETGKIKIKLEVSRINLSVLKVRMRPRSPDFEDPNPCHFSGKFEIGGEVTDLTMSAEINPLAQALAGSPGYCFLAFTDEPNIKWKIGGLNLKPLQNNLDAMGKDMIEDALNNGMSNLFYTKFIEISRMIVPKYFSGCEKAYANNKELIEQIQSAVKGENTNSGNGSGNDAAKWVISPVPTMKGVLGRLDINFPADVERNILIYQPSDNKFITSVSRNDKIYTIAPGQYRFTLTNVPVNNVPIQKGHETRLKAGFLNIVSDGNWHLYNDTKEKAYTSGNKPKKLPLPVGSYQLKLGLNFYPFVIKDGETLEY